MIYELPRLAVRGQTCVGGRGYRNTQLPEDIVGVGRYRPVAVCSSVFVYTCVD